MKFGTLFTSVSRETKFWNWFTKHQSAYLKFESNQDHLFSEMAKRLNKVDSHLTFEFGPPSPDGRRQFIISADGIKKGFPAVRSLVNSAPELNGWKIIAFRQAQPGMSQIKVGEVILEFSNVYFRHAKDEHKLALELHIRNYEDTNEYGMAVFLMLDTLIGEYDTEMMLSFIDKKKLNEDLRSQLDPITDLPMLLEQHKKQVLQT